MNKLKSNGKYIMFLDSDDLFINISKIKQNNNIYIVL